MMKTTAVVVPMLFVVVACGGDEGGGSCADFFDAPLDSEASAGVGLCVGPLGTGPGGERTCEVGCSGTLIARNLVLTARHCVQAGTGPLRLEERFETLLDARALHVLTSRSWAAGGPPAYAVARVLVPESTEATQDLALVITEDGIDGASLARVDLRGSLAESEPLAAMTIEGRGTSLPNLFEEVPYVCASDSAAEPCISYSGMAPPPSYTFSLPLEYAAFGAGETSFLSGAGIYAGAGCTARVVAVQSGVTHGLDSSPIHTLGVRVSRFADFLRAGADTAARLGAYEPPTWATN